MPPPAPPPEPCPPGQPCPPTKVLADAGLAAPEALGGASAVPRPAEDEDAGEGGAKGKRAAAAESPAGAAAAPPLDAATGGATEEASAAAAAAKAAEAAEAEAAATTTASAPGVEAAAERGRLGALRGDLLAVVAGQGRQVGRLVNACPAALLDDGMLDFTLAFGTPGQQAASFARDVAARGPSEARGGLLLLRAPWLLVEAAGGRRLKTNRDGEPTLESSRLLFEVRPRAIRMHLPDCRLLLAGLPERERAAAARASPPTARGGRRRLLRRLFEAQQPPGRGAKRVAAAKRALWSLLRWAAAFGAGVAVGLLARGRVR